MGSLGRSASRTGSAGVEYHEFVGSPGFNSYETSSFFDSDANANQKAWEDALRNDKDAYHAMKDFTGSEYNGYFKQLYKTDLNDIDYKARQKITALSNVIGDYDLKQNIVVHRRTNYRIFGKSSDYNMNLKELQSMEGKFVHNNSFLSSSAAKEGKAVAADKVELKIYVPAGKGWGAFVGKSGLSSLGKSESEFLFNNNLWFRVGKTRYNSSKHINEVEMFVVGRSSGQKFDNDAITDKPTNRKKK